MKIEKTLFGTLPDGRGVDKYTLTNKAGASVSLLSYGGIVNSIIMPDRDGNLDEIACGFDDIDSYLKSAGYIGALIGRYCNRIGHAQFTLNGVTYKLFKNSCGEDCLHGGEHAFNSKIWDAETFEDTDCAGVVFSIFSPDMEENFPGNLKVKVTYTFDEQSRLFLHYEAWTDRDTVLNMTNHAYFNLAGPASGSVMDHYIRIDGDYYIPTDERQIPVGDPIEVTGTIYDFRKEKKVENPIDHSFIRSDNTGFSECGKYSCRENGRYIKVYTDLPCLHLYTGCVMDSPVPFRGGVEQIPLHALCLETQFAPDSPNRPDFPSTVITPKNNFDHMTLFEFGVED